MKQIVRKIWDAVVNRLCSIAFDKWLHFICGVLIAALFCITFGMKDCFVPVLFAGFGKEIFDQFTTGNFDWKDFLATCIGGLTIQLFQIFALL